MWRRPTRPEVEPDDRARMPLPLLSAALTKRLRRECLIEKEFVELITGSLASFDVTGGSGQTHGVHFCKACGTHVWSDYRAAPGDGYFVRLRALEKPELLLPDVHIFTHSKAVWPALPDTTPVFEAFYDIKAVWPQSSLERLGANMRGSSANRA